MSDPTQPAAFADTISWLYSPTGDASCGPLQEGVADGALNPSRVGVVRGIVRDLEGQPLAGASIRVVGAPELGRTRSRGDGVFDMAVNAGGKITIEIGGAEFLTVHRRTAVPVHGYGWVEPSVLKPRSNVATRVQLSGADSLQVVRDIVADLDASWEERAYPRDGDHDHCPLSHEKLSAEGPTTVGYWDPDYGWISPSAYREEIVGDRYGVRARISEGRVPIG